MCVAGGCLKTDEFDEEEEDDMAEEEGDGDPDAERPVMSGHDGAGKLGLASMDWGGAFMARAT